MPHDNQEEQFSEMILTNKNYKMISRDISEIKGIVKAYDICQGSYNSDKIFNELNYRLRCLDEDIKIICKKYNVKKEFKEIVI